MKVTPRPGPMPGLVEENTQKAPLSPGDAKAEAAAEKPKERTNPNN